MSGLWMVVRGEGVHTFRVLFVRVLWWHVKSHYPDEDAGI